MRVPLQSPEQFTLRVFILHNNMPTPIELTDRLYSELQNAALVVDGISGVVTPYNPSTVVIYPSTLQAAAQPTINAFDGSQAAQDAWNAIPQAQKDAILLINLLESYPRAYRAVAALTVDELNTIRQWIVAFKAATAAATSLANLQTRVAALPDLPNRTLAQAKTAFISKVNSGT